MFENSQKLNFNPNLCRNESEVESKLIVQYLLPKLGYSPETWNQEIAFGNIRLDFLALATEVITFKLDANSPLNVVMEAKHPKENLDRHLRKLRKYLTTLNLNYGLITNGRELRIYQNIKHDLKLVFQCQGQNIETRFDEIDRLNSLIPQPNNPLTLLNQLNETELTVKLQRSKIRGADKIAKNIVASRKKKSQQKFENYSDVVTSVSGLGDKTIVTIIDDWS